MVTSKTCVSEIIEFLQEHKYLPSSLSPLLHYGGLYVPGRRFAMYNTETMEALRVGPLSHLHFRVGLPGSGALISMSPPILLMFSLQLTTNAPSILMAH